MVRATQCQRLWVSGDNAIVSNLPSGPTGDFDARAGLARLGAFAAVGGGLSVLGALGLGVPCPWRELTGTLCPLCGSTHLGMSLLRGDLAGALAANPFVFAILSVTSVLGVLWTIEALGGPRVRLPGRRRPSADQWWLALAVLGIGYAVVRNVW